MLMIKARTPILIRCFTTISCYNEICVVSGLASSEPGEYELPSPKVAARKMKVGAANSRYSLLFGK